MILFRLRWIFLAMVLPGLIGLVLALSALYRVEQTQLGEQVLQTAQMLSARVDADIGGEQRALLGFASSSGALAAEDFRALHAEARRFMQATGYGDAMLLIDRDGRQHVNTRLPYGSALPRTANADLLHQVLSSGAPAVSAVFFGAARHHAVVSIAVPVLRGGQIRYSLNLSLNAENLARQVRTENLPSGWSMLIFDRGGTVAVQLPASGPRAGQHVAPALLAATRNAAAGPLATGGLVGAYNRSALTGYTVALLMPQRQVWSTLAGRLLPPSLVLLGILLISLLLIHHFTRQMLSSLQALSQAVDAAADGQRDVRVPTVGPAEFIRVARQFNAMIAALHAAEGTQQRLNRALRLVSECNSLLVHEHHEAALLLAVCRMTVEAGGYQMAWIGEPLDDVEKTVRPMAQSGYEDGYLDSIRVSWGDNALGQGPTGMAIRSRATQINQDYLANPRMRPWREAALLRGYQASIALPLLAGGTTLGVFTIYAREAHAFGPEEVALLEQLAADLAFGMAAIRTETGYRRVLDNAADAVLIFAADDRIRYANLQAATLLGREAGQLLSCRMHELAAPDSRAAMQALFETLHAHQATRAELNLQALDGRVLPVELNAVRLPDGNCYAACRDIAERKRYEAELQHLATHDKLTGLVNRQLLNDRIEQAIVHARRDDGVLVAMLLDLDRFKTINDSLTHETGDALLCEVARRLSGLFRAGDTVARLGGDEFMVILSGVPSRERAAVLAQSLLETVSQRLLAAGHHVVVTCSVGIALFPGDGETALDLIKNADVAMYRAKELGGNSFQFYAPEMNARMLERLELENDLRRAQDEGQLELYYQPKVDARSRRIVGAEALIRWNHPRRGLVEPVHFIPLAEETGLILPLGEWVLRQACAQLRRWLDDGLDGFVLSVNLSVRQLQQDGLESLLRQVLAEQALPPALLELEVTESALMINPAKSMRIVQALKQTGVRIALDDFGTGYASLSYLKNFPVDTLKIDQSFVRGLHGDMNDAAIARLVIHLGHDLNMKVVAEGVETDAQRGFLAQHRCDEMQGFYFSRPLPVAGFSALLQVGQPL